MAAILSTSGHVGMQERSAHYELKENRVTNWDGVCDGNW